MVYKVCCVREFKNTLDQLFGTIGGVGDSDSIGDLLSGMDEDASEENVEDIESGASDNEVVKLVNKVIIDAYQQGASDIHIEP